MKILKAYVQSDGQLLIADVVEFEGKTWLVPHWIDFPLEKVSRPLRIIRLDSLPHQKVPPNDHYQYIVDCPIPKCVFEGQIPPQSQIAFEIVESPEISVPILSASNLH